MRDLPRKTDPFGEIPMISSHPNSAVKLTESGLHPRPVPSNVVALAVVDRRLDQTLRQSFVGAPFYAEGRDAIPFASAIIVDGGDPVAAIARVRSAARTDAAILYVADASRPEAFASAHAAGAFACLRSPFTAAELTGLVTSALDATATKSQVADLTKQLDLQTHLASIGRMSAGLSHELGNPLAVIAMTINYVRLECARVTESERLLRELTTTPSYQLERSLQAARAHLATAGNGTGELMEGLDDIGASQQRMTALLETLRTLVGSRAAKLEVIDVGQLVHDIRRWAAEPFHGVEVEMEGEPLKVLADRSLLTQILINLGTNAALAAKGLSSPRVRFHSYATGVEQVTISIRDNGPGIPAEIQDKIFEPFFTTRRGRGGTGLGLALCREYARQMGAELSFWSVLGRGACFRVSLRRAV